MNWAGHDHVIGALTAVGARGNYSVQQVGAEWILQGHGHDGLPIPTLLHDGKRFAELTDAKLYANHVDKQTVAPSRPTVPTATHSNRLGAKSNG